MTDGTAAMVRVGGVNESASRGGFTLSRFRSAPDAEARILLLIDAFSRNGDQPRMLEGRVKLAKLDFLLRYPRHLKWVLEKRNVSAKRLHSIDPDQEPLAERMVRYRYGPWDPSYYAVLGSLLGRGLIETLPLPGTRAAGYRTTTKGAHLCELLTDDECYSGLVADVQLLRRTLDLTGTTLKKLIYELPDVSGSSWRKELL